MFYFYAACLLLMNTAAFLLMRKDKLLAKQHKQRIPESVLFLFAALGGSLGGCLGMYCFRHKTKHIKFVIGFPLLFLLHCILTAVLFCKGILVIS